MENTEILAIYGTNYKEMTKKLLEEGNMAERIPDKECRIIEYLQEQGFRNLVMLEGSWVGDKTAEAAELCGYYHLSKKYQVEFLDMQKDSYEAYDCEGMDLRICDEAVKLDFLINVPVMKGHCQTKMTCALKNMKGLIPNVEKRHFHALGLHKPIAHLSSRLRQDFIVVDNICGDWDFEDGGNPVVMNRIMVAADPVLCDAFVCHLMGYEVEEVPYIRMAEELGVGLGDWELAKYQELNQPEKGICTPKERKVVELADAVEEVESCSACYGYLLPALQRLKEEGLFEKLQDKICIGQGYRGKTGKLGIGQCTRKFEYHLEGCPPTEGAIYEFLKEYLEEN